MGHFENSNVRPASPIVFKSGAPVSVVCVAATFTTLTYADNGGKVQLSSAGVHGLTTSPAVGSNVYVSWASGTGVSGLYTVLSVDDANKITIGYTYAVGLGTPTTAVAGTTITAVAISIPALSSNGRIEVGAGAAITASASLRELSFFLGSSAFSSRNTSSGTDVAISILGFLQNRGSDNSQICSGFKIKETVSSIPYDTLSINTAISQTLKLTVKMAAANVMMRIEQYLIEVFI